MIVILEIFYALLINLFGGSTWVLTQLLITKFGLIPFWLKVYTIGMYVYYIKMCIDYYHDKTPRFKRFENFARPLGIVTFLNILILMIYNLIYYHQIFSLEALI